MLAAGRSEEDIVAAIDCDYEVDPATARRDVRGLIEQLAAERLISAA
jgi:hypothetical protein